MVKTSMFSIGDGVRVVDDYFVAPLCGAIGTIAVPSESVRGVAEGCYWVEFDEVHADSDGGLIEAAEIDGAELRLL